METICQCGNVVEPYRVKQRHRTCAKCGFNKLSSSARSKTYKGKRELVMEHYGNKCVICGTTEDLEIDHKLGNGKEERKTVKQINLPDYIINNNFPNDYQLLCRKHNMMKQDMPMDVFVAECILIAEAMKG